MRNNIVSQKRKNIYMYIYIGVGHGIGAVMDGMSLLLYSHDRVSLYIYTYVHVCTQTLIYIHTERHDLYICGLLGLYWLILHYLT